MLATMGESLAVELGPVALVATIESPNGRVRLT